MVKTKLKKIEINAENPFVLLMAYGTLRKGLGNFQHCLKDKSEFLGTFKTDPIFTMYGLHSGYPIVCTDGDTAIEYDLFKVTDNNVLARIHNLEGCTGYIDHTDNWYNIIELETPLGLACMYVQHEKFEENNIIESGNWLDK